jgi:hypothetical protein
MEQTTQAKTYYTLNDAAKATGKDKRTLKKYREDGQLSADPILEGERIAGWKFDPAELARVFPESFKPLEQLEDDAPKVNGHKDMGPSGLKGTEDDIIRSYQEMNRVLQSQIRLLEDALDISKESEKQARRDAREEREAIREERADLHKIIETTSQSMRLLTDERQRPPSPVAPPPIFTRTHYVYFAVVLTLIAAGLLYNSFVKV